MSYRPGAKRPRGTPHNYHHSRAENCRGLNPPQKGVQTNFNGIFPRTFAHRRIKNAATKTSYYDSETTLPRLAITEGEVLFSYADEFLEQPEHDTDNVCFSAFNGLRLTPIDMANENVNYRRLLDRLTVVGVMATKTWANLSGTASTHFTIMSSGLAMIDNNGSKTLRVGCRVLALPPKRVSATNRTIAQPYRTFDVTEPGKIVARLEPYEPERSLIPEMVDSIIRQAGNPGAAVANEHLTAMDEYAKEWLAGLRECCGNDTLYDQLLRILVVRPNGLRRMMVAGRMMHEIVEKFIVGRMLNSASPGYSGTIDVYKPK